MPQHQSEFNPDIIDALFARIAHLENQMRLSTRTPSVIERVNPLTLPDPVEAQIAIHSRTFCLIRYANGKWRAICYAVHAMKVFGDMKNNTVRNGAFRFSLESDLNGFDVVGASAFNGTAGSGDTTLTITNETRELDILNSELVIPGGEYDSGNDLEDADINDGGDPDDPNNRVYTHDRIWINTTAVGSGSKGLGVYMMFREK